MTKSICKRTISSLLVILMVVATFCFADIGLTASAWVDSAQIKYSERPNTTVDAMFLVPETIYLNPAGDTYSYYVDASESGELTANPAKTSGQIVFRSDVPVENLRITRSDAETTYTSSVETMSLTTTFSDIGSARDGDVITWKATYNVDDVAYESYAYTYVYKPYADIIGQAFRGTVKSDSTTRSMVKGSISVVTGFHAADNTYTGNRSWGGTNDIPSPQEAEINKTGAQDWGINCADNAENYLTATTNGGIYFEDLGESDAWSLTQGINSVSTGAITVDRSRYTNMNQIPYLQAVNYQYYNEWEQDGCAEYSVGTTTDGSLSASVDCMIYNVTNHFGNGGATPESFYSSTRINCDVSDFTESSFYLWSRVCSNGLCAGALENNCFKVYSNARLHVMLVDKSSLRSVYRLACTLAVESENSYAGYSTFKSALKAAGAVLGNPKATSGEITSAYAELNSAYTALKNQLATVPSNGVRDIYFYVPETIYVNPANGTAFQYFIDRNNGDNSALRNSNNTTGNIYFKCSDTTATVTGLTVSCSTGFTAPSINATTSSSNSLATYCSGGSLSNALGSGGTAQLTWTVSYKINGRTYTATAYSTVYRNLVGASSLIAATAHGRYASNYHTNSSICVTVWVAGAHSANFNKATNPDGFTGTASGEEGDGRGSYKGRVLEGASVPGAGENNVNVGESGTGWSGYYNKDDNTDYTGGAGWIHVDTSRYGNLNQIPNLQFGLDNNYELSVKNDVGKLYYRRQGGSDTEVYNWSGSSAPNRLTTQAFNIAVSGTGNFWIQIYGYGMKQANGDRYSRARCYLYVDQFSKAELRNKINEEVSVGRQSIWYTSTSWKSYCNYMKKAFNCLGDPTNTDTAVGIAAVDKAISILVLRESNSESNQEGTLSAKHWSDTLSNSSNAYNLLGTDDAQTYTYGSVLYAGPNTYTGYTYSGSFGAFDVETWNALDGKSGNAISAVSIDAATRSITVTGTESNSYTRSAWTNGANTSNAYYFVPASPNTEYTFSYTGSGVDGSAFILYVDADFNYIGHDSLSGLGDQSMTATTPPNCRYLQFCFGVGVGTKTYANVRLIGGSWDTCELAELPNMVYNMYYTPKEYTVTYNPNGGTFNETTENTTDTVLYDDAYTVGKIGTRNNKTQVDVPTRNGYTFSDWFCSATNASVDHASTVSPWHYDMDVEYTANWTPYSYTLTYNGNGATDGSIANVSTTYGAEIITPACGYTRTGYSLCGWSAYSNTPCNTSNAHLIPIDTLTSVDNIANAQGSNGMAADNGSTLTLYAIWLPNTYELTINPNGGTMEASSVTYVKGSTDNQKNDSAFSESTAFDVDNNTIASITSPTRAGYTFSGWSVYGENGGFSFPNLRFVDGDCVSTSLTKTVSADGYTNYKWNQGETAVATNAWKNVSYATYSVVANETVTISGYIRINSASQIGINLLHGDNSNDFNNNLASYSYTDGEWKYFSVSRTFTEESATAVFQFYTENGIGKSGMILDFDVKDVTIRCDDPKTATLRMGTTPVTMTAQWSPITYTIFYDMNGGTNACDNPSEYTVESEDIVLIPPTRMGYTFTGWTGSNGSTPQQSVTILRGETGDRSYTANWTFSSIVVSLNAMGGTCKPEKIVVNKGTAYGDLPVAVREGYYFKGWYTDESSGSLVTGSTMVTATENHTLYAHWSMNPPSNLPRVYIPEETVRIGQIVDVPVQIINNPGIIAAKLNIEYDTDQLQLLAVFNGDVMPDESFTAGNNLAANPYSLIWVDATASSNYTSDGTLVTLRFKAMETAQVGLSTIHVTYDSDSTFNYNLTNVSFSISEAGIQIEKFSGDANNDGELNLKDVAIIKRALAGGYGVTMAESNADVNADGVVNLKDVAIIKRYLADGFNVMLR